MAMAKESMAKTLREIADALESEVVKPSILKEVKIFITKFPMAKVLTCPEEKLSKCPPELLTAMSSNSTLREVSLHDCLMDRVEPTLLPMALSNLVKVDFSNSNLGEQQLSAIFSFMVSGSKIESLNLEEVDLSNVAPELLPCSSKLLEFNLSAMLMTNEQSRVLWNAIVEEKD